VRGATGTGPESRHTSAAANSEEEESQRHVTRTRDKPREIADGRSLNLLRPEAQRVRDPALGSRTDSRTEAVSDVGILVVLDGCSHAPQGRDEAFHCGRRGDAVAFTGDNKRRRFG